MGNAIELKNLTKTYGDFSLDHIDLTLPKGCIMGFVGENGAGKSTTIKLILGLIHRDSGEIYVLGEDPHNCSAAVKEQIGVVLDDCCFPELLSAMNMESILKNSYHTWDTIKFHQYLEKFSLPLKKPIKDYSRGMKMKLSIAVALSHHCSLLILDEATSGLDPMVRDEILDIFYDFIQEESHSILISSHIISDLEKICDYITFIHEGKIVFTEEKDVLLEKYAILKCGKSEYDSLNTQDVIGMRKSDFGITALVERSKMPTGLTMEIPTIEDIMLFYVKERAI